MVKNETMNCQHSLPLIYITSAISKGTECTDTGSSNSPNSPPHIWGGENPGQLNPYGAVHYLEQGGLGNHNREQSKYSDQISDWST